MSEQKPMQIWYVERNESGDYDVTDYPGYCEEYQPELPDEAELVLKSAFDKAVKALRHYALANGGNHPSGNVARNCLKDLGESNG